MMESFALRNITNLTQGSGTALHPGRTLDGPGFLMFLTMEQLAAEQASIPSDAFFPDSDGQIVKTLGNGQRIDLAKAAIAPVEKGAELAYNKKAPYSILDRSIQHPVSSIKYPVSSIKYPASSIQHQVSRKLDLHRSGPRPELRIQDPELKTQDSSLSPVSCLKSPVSSLKSHIPSLLSQVSCLIPCVYPLTDQVVKGDITLSQATEDVHRLDVSHVNARAGMRTAFTKRHLMNQLAMGRRLKVETPYSQDKAPKIIQPSVVYITSLSEPIERVVQTSPPDQLFLRFKPTNDHGSRTHNVVYTNTREVLPRSSMLRPGVIPDDITESPHAIVLPKAPAGEQIPYANPKSDTSDSWARVAGNVEEKKLGNGIASVKHGSGYTEENSEVSVQVRGTSEVYRQLRTGHASQVKLSAQAQRVIYIPNSSGKLEQQEISEIGERPISNNAIYSRSGSPAGEVMRTPISEDNPGSLEPQLTMERPTHQIAVSVDESQIIQNTDGIRFSTIPSSAFEEASFAGVDKVQEPQHQEIIPQTPREYVRTEDDIQEIQPELAGEKRVDRTHQRLQQEITSQGAQEYGKHPQINDEVKSETRYGAAPLDAFEGTSVAEKVQESQQQEIIPQTPREYVRIENNIQEIQPELVAEEKVDRTHQQLQQEITSQDVQEYGKHPQINDEVRSEMRYGAAPLDAFEGASVAEKVQESQQQEIIPQTPREYVRTEDNIQEVQPELVAEEKADTIHQPLRQEIITQDVQEYGKQPQLNDEVKIETRYGAAPLDAFVGASVAEKVQESQPQKIMPQTPREYVRIEGNIQEIQPELVAENKADGIHQPLRQEIITQDVQEYGKQPQLNDEVKIETRYEAEPLNAFEGVSVAEKVQKSQPQEIIPQTPREYVRIESNIQEIQPELVAERNVDRIYQPLRQEISPQDVQEYGKHPELNEEIKIETRRGAASPDAFEVGSLAEKVQKSQPQEIILQAVQESVRAKDDVQEIQPELSRNKETGRIQQLVQQEVGSQNVQDYGKNPEFRVESQPYGKEIQATASMPELQDKIPFYVSKMVAGERSEAIWIQLEPEHLGKVKLRVLLRDNKISVNLSVDRPETKGIIELQVPDIRRSLAQHEIDVAEFRVSLENGFSNSNPRYSNLLHDNSDTDSRPAYERGDWNRNQSEHSNRQRYYRSDSLVDLFA